MRKLSKQLLVFIVVFSMLTSFFNFGVQAKNDVNASHEKAISKIKDRLDGKTTSQEDKTKELRTANENPNEKVRLIVHMDAEPAVKRIQNASFVKNQEEVKKAQNLVRSREKEIKAKMQMFGIPYVSLNSLDTIVSAFSIEVERKYIDKIAKIEGVIGTQEAVKYVIPKDEMKPTMVESVKLIGAPTVWNETGYKGEGQVVAILDTGADINHKDFNLDDEAKAKIALTKEKVEAIKKTEHLPGNYFNEKFPYVYNYQDQTDDVLDSYGSRHGMHVAGTVAGNGQIDPNTPFKGVAPNAQLVILKVFSNDPTNSSTYTDVQCKAIEDAIKLGVDSMNLSLGSSASFVDKDAMYNEAFKNAIDAGILVAVAAGNDGTVFTDYKHIATGFQENPDVSTVGAPGLSQYSTCVASFNNTAGFRNTLILKNNTDSTQKEVAMAYGVGVPESDVSGAGVYCGIGTPGDFQNVDVNGKIAVIDRGAIPFGEKVNNAVNNGAIGVVIANTQEVTMNMIGISNTSVPSGIIKLSDGKYLKDNIDNITIQFTKEKSILPFDDKGVISEFSSWGTPADLSIKPEVMAPGGNIYSLDEYNKYQYMSGTSMATPHVAGAAAIVNQFVKDPSSVFNAEIYKSKAAKEEIVKLLLMNTAVPQKAPNAIGDDVYYPVRRQGAGLISLTNVVKNKVLARVTSDKDTLKDGKAELKELKESTVNFKVELTNYSNEDVKYKVDISMLKDLIGQYNMSTETSVDVSFSSNQQGMEVNVPKFGSTTVDISASFGDEIPMNSFVEGYVRFINTSNNSSDLTVPYLGFYGDWNAPHIFDNFATDDGWANFFDDNFRNSPGVFRADEQALNVGEVNGKPYYLYNPNDKFIQLRFSLLRNAEDFKLDLLDANNGFIRNLSTYSTFRRSFRAKNFGMFWGNDTVVPKDAEPKMFENGYYGSFKLSGKVNADWITEKQEKIVPFYCDGVAPVIENAKIVEENGKKYVTFTLKDDIALALVGVQSVDENGSLGKFIEATDLQYDRHFIDDSVKPLIDDVTLKSLLTFVNGNEVKILVDNINTLKDLTIYTRDAAGNFTNAFVDLNNQVEKVNVTINNKQVKVWIPNLGPNGIYQVQNDGETIELSKGLSGEIQVIVPEPTTPGNRVVLESFNVVDADTQDILLTETGLKYVAKANVYYTEFGFENNIIINANFKEEPIPPTPAGEYPEGPYPAIFTNKPQQHWFVSEVYDVIENAEVIDGKVQIDGYVGYTPINDLVDLKAEFVNPNTNEVVSSTVIDRAKWLEDFVHLQNGDDVIYDGLAVHFKTELAIPENFNHLILRITAVNSQKKEGVVGFTIFADLDAPELKISVDKRDINSENAVLNYTITDDSLGFSIDIFDEAFKKIITKEYSEENTTADAGNFSVKDKVTLNLKDGVNTFYMQIREFGVMAPRTFKVVYIVRDSSATKAK